MRILELQEFAKKNGYDSTEFKFKNLKGEELRGKWVDAYYGFFWIEGMDDDTFMSVRQWREFMGDEVIEFTV